MSDTSPRQLLAIDPGIVHPAAARFVDGTLVAAERTPNRKAWNALDLGPRCLNIARAACSWSVAAVPAPPTHMVIEWPVAYGDTKSRGVDSNDLVPLAGMAMAVVGILSTLCPELVVTSPRPSDVWHQLPKTKLGDPWASVRGAYIRRRLSPAEFAAVVPSHDAIDAVGLGLYVLGRMARVRNLPGTT